MDYPKQNDDYEVTSLPYFHADLTRVQAEDILKRYVAIPHHFLLRWSSSYRKIAVSCVVNGKKVRHALILRTSTAGRFYLEDGLVFDALNELIDHYSRTEIPNFTNKSLHVKLRYPVVRFRRPVPRPWEQDVVQYSINEEHPYNEIGEHLWGSAFRTPNTFPKILTPTINSFTPTDETTAKLTCLEDAASTETRYLTMSSRATTESVNPPPIPDRKTLSCR